MSHSGKDNLSGKYELREPMEFGYEKFELTEAQITQLNEWAIGVEQRAAAIQFENAQQKCQGVHYPVKLPDHGTIGGGYSFTFTPTGIGVECRVTESITGESINLTDYDSW